MVAVVSSRGDLGLTNLGLICKQEGFEEAKKVVVVVGVVWGLSTTQGILESQLGTTGKDRFLCAAKISFNIPGC